MVKSVPSNLWILAVLTPVSLVMVVIVMAVAIICRRNRNVFKSSAFRGFHPRTKVRTPHRLHVVRQPGPLRNLCLCHHVTTDKFQNKYCQVFLPVFCTWPSPLTSQLVVVMVTDQGGQRLIHSYSETANNVALHCCLCFVTGGKCYSPSSTYFHIHLTDPHDWLVLL